MTSAASSTLVSQPPFAVACERRRESSPVAFIANGKVITKISEGTAKDVELAVDAAENAYKTTWGLKTPGSKRGELLYKLAELMEKNKEELAAIEALDNGKTYTWASAADIPSSIDTIRYYAGWADKVHGKVIEVCPFCDPCLIYGLCTRIDIGSQVDLHQARTHWRCRPDYSLYVV